MTDIVSPLPGTFYRKSSPEADQFFNPGDEVAIDDTIGLIEVMKTFIEVKAEVAGKFKDYTVEDGTAVTPGDVVAELES